MNQGLLKVRNLKTQFLTDEGVVKAVNDVSFTITAEEAFGLVGESGCGKSTVALSIIRLVPEPGAKIAGGQIIFEGEDLLQKTESEMQKIRGCKISMIFQEPMTSLDPVFPAGNEIIETIMLHQGLSRKKAEKKSIEMLKFVGIADAERRMKEFPHQLSGGMRQRVMIAIALACKPKLLIADEPTTSLDVTTQAQILRLIDQLRKDFSTAFLLITHNLGLVAQHCDRMAVMHAGEIVEYGSVEAVFERPLHPYTAELSKATPRLDVKSRRLEVIKGAVPDLIHLPAGCLFHRRCPYVMEICLQNHPQLEEYHPQHFKRCFLKDIPW